MATKIGRPRHTWWYRLKKAFLLKKDVPEEIEFEFNTENVRSLVEKCVIDACSDKNYSIHFTLDTTSLPFKEGRLITARAMTHSDMSSTIIIYIRSLMRDYPEAWNRNFDIGKFKEYFDPILAEQLFALSQPLKYSINPMIDTTKLN